MRIEVERRPLLLACVGLIAGITSLEHPVNAFLLLLAIALARGLSPRLALALGLLVGVLVGPRLPAAGIVDPVPIDGPADVVSVPRIVQDGCIAEVDVSGTRYLLRVRGRTELAMGDRIHVTADAKPFMEGFEGLYLHRMLIGRIQASDGDIQVVERGPSIYQAGARWRRSFVDFTSKTLTPQTSALVDALCFNVDGGLDDATRASLQSTGTIHIVSASGLHVMVFAFALQWLLALLPIPRPAQLLILALVLGLYACSAGLRPPVIRAVSMALLYSGAYLLRREPDLLSSLAAVAIVFLLFRPEAVYDVGFQFSFVTVAAIGLFSRRDAREAQGLSWRLRAAAGQSVRVGLIAGLAAAPLTALYFGMISIVSLPANLLIAPAIPAIVVLSMLAYLIGAASPSAAQFVMSGAVEPLCGWVRWVIGELGSPSWSVAATPAIGGYWIAVFYAAALLTWRKQVRYA